MAFVLHVNYDRSIVSLFSLASLSYLIIYSFVLVGGNTAVLGFVGAPWTIATYIVEGCTTRTHTTIKTMCHTAPHVLSVEDSPTLHLQRVQRPRQRLKKEKEIQQNAPYH